MHTFDSSGNELGALAMDFAWAQSSDPSFMEAQVPNDTPLPSDNSVVALMRDFPSAGVTTWYSPTNAAISTGNVQAAIDTLSATGAQITDAAAATAAALAAAAKAAEAAAKNIVPILVGLAALFLWFEAEKRK